MGYQLSPSVERMVRERMNSGHYASEDEVLIDAMLVLEDVQRRQEELRDEIQRRLAKAGTPLSRPLDRATLKTEVLKRFNRMSDQC
jgi:putative addiction module CopG family antidote